MSNTETNSCRTISWIIAVGLAIAAYVLARGWLDWGFFGSFLGAVLVFFIAGYFLLKLLCGAAPETARPAAVAASPAPTPTPKPAPVAAPASKPAAAPAPAPVQKTESETGQPAPLDGPRDGQADDLKMIKGVGPALEKQLNGLGIYHFDQVAGWNAAELAWVDDNLLRFKGRASRDNWIEQATTLATGGDTAFSKRFEDGDVY